ncbi:MAG: hypothetical protein P8107_10245 [Spirochaetia bacterium]
MFENKITFDFNTNQLILQEISSIDSFRGKWDVSEKKENRYLKELKRIATILLLQYGYLFVQYISFEHIIEKKERILPGLNGRTKNQVQASYH